MADHGHVEYATATGNDMPAHETTYENFIQLAYVGSALVISIVIGLAIGAVNGHWLVGIPIIFVLAPIVAAHGLVSGSRAPSGAMVVVALVALALTA
jgi:aa3 type cytochrome c oxidase subunit IV